MDLHLIFFENLLRNFSARLIPLAVMILLSMPIAGQELPDSHQMEEDAPEKKKTLGKDLKLGTFEFHARTNFMSTRNRGNLLNYSALATGAGMGYYSPSWKGFHVGFSGFFVFQVFENNIRKADPTTNRVNRYEITLFDMNDLSNRRDLDRMEELFIDYENKGLYLRLGRQKFNSPLLNEQDNRMRGNIFNGLTARYQWENFELTGAFFNAMTIRGTVDWYSVEESFGVYPFGRSPFGEASDYKGNVRSSGIGVLGMKHHGKHFKTEAWNYTAENVFNLTMGQTEFHHQFKDMEYQLGIQGFYQTALNEGGNPDPVKAFTLPEERTYALGGKAEFRKQNNALILSSLHISDRGRFLFPREWGREIFYATLTRERFEGSGGVNAYTLKYRHQYPGAPLRTELGTSLVRQSDIKDFRINKYGMPSYYHFSGVVDYQFSGYLEGLDLKLLIVNKTAQNPNQVPDEFRINRVDLWHFNMVVDYRF